MNIFEQLDRLVDIHGMMYDDLDTIDAVKSRLTKAEAERDEALATLAAARTMLDATGAALAEATKRIAALEPKP